MKAKDLIARNEMKEQRLRIPIFEFEINFEVECIREIFFLRKNLAFIFSRAALKQI